MEHTPQFTTSASACALNQIAFAAFAAIKLNENNHNAWKKQALACIKVNKLQSHLNPLKIPARFSSELNRVNGIENQEYEEWEIHDQWLVAWLIASMEPSFVN